MTSDKVEHLLGQAVQLNPADPNNITIAVEMAQALSHVFSVYVLQARSVPPMVLSATAELHEHLDSLFCKVISTPIWSNIHPDNPQSQDSPLYPLSIHYGKVLPPPPFPPATGPSALNTALPLDPDVLAGKGKGKEKAHPEDEPADDRGHGIERGKWSHPHTMSTRSHSHVTKAKHQHAISKAMITSEDERELDIAPIAEQPPTTRNKLPLANRLPPGVKLPPTHKGSRQCRKLVSMVVVISDDEGTQAVPQPAVKKAWKGYVEITETDEEMPMNVGHALKMGTAYVEILPAPKVTKAVPVIAATVAVDLAEDDHANLTSEVWLPGCSSCVQKALHKCGGKGSVAPNRGKKATATTTHCIHSRSHRRPSLVHVSPETDTAAPAAATTSGAPVPEVPPAPTLPSGIVSPIARASTSPLTATAIPTTTILTTTILTTTILTTTILTTTSPPTATADPLVVALRVEVATLQTTVASLEEKVSCGEKLLLEANQRLAEQEASSKLLATQFEQLCCELLPPNLPSPAEVCLPVIVGNSGTVADGAGPVASALCNVEAEAAAESASVEAAAESASVVLVLGNVEAEAALFSSYLICPYSNSSNLQIVLKTGTASAGTNGHYTTPLYPSIPLYSASPISGYSVL
ncbi:hypothetical protein EDB19DRAFT_1947457 [Suillus lakei]|nr:hypothetical protein EDB19DRAFT_1947457 [Suillus lakei]